MSDGSQTDRGRVTDRQTLGELEGEQSTFEQGVAQCAASSFIIQAARRLAKGPV